MQNRATSRWLAAAIVLLLASALLSACSGREPAAEETTALLPRLTINIDEQGYPKIIGISLETLGKLLRQDFSALRVPPDLLAQLQAADVQHVETVMTKHGLLFFVNGKPMPYLAADKEALHNLGETITALDVKNAKVIRWILDNIVARVGLPVAVKFPIAAGKAEIPLRENRDVPIVDVDSAHGQVSAPLMRVHADVAVDSQGMPTIAGIPLSQLQQSLDAAGVAADLSGLRLSPALVATLTGADVQHVQIETEPEGLYLYLNGQPMPRVAWDEERLRNTIDLYERLAPDSPNVDLLRFLQPYIQPTDVELTLFLPKEPGAAEVAPRPFIEQE